MSMEEEFKDFQGTEENEILESEWTGLDGVSQKRSVDWMPHPCSFWLDLQAFWRVIGPEMPSAELLAAAAKLTEAEAELREAELDGDTELFIGPPPPAVVTEAESANEAERFEESLSQNHVDFPISQMLPFQKERSYCLLASEAEEDSPYDILGVNKNMSPENMKKRCWKLSLMVHPDKCSHPQAHQAFVKLNKAFKDLQDPDKTVAKRYTSHNKYSSVLHL
ncbi:UNVERIFIED_CONTAM: DnaJ subfamily C member 10 [Sesamum indicum]